MSKKKKDSLAPVVPPPSVALPPITSAKSAPRPLITRPPVDLDAVTDDDLERVLKAIAIFDPRRVLDEDGNGLPLDQLDDATALALAGFEVEHLYERGERGAPRIDLGVLRKFRLSDRKGAIEILLRLHGKLRNVGDAPPAPEEQLKELEAARKEAKELLEQLRLSDR